jgi:hypothetical protein
LEKTQYIFPTEPGVTAYLRYAREYRNKGAVFEVLLLINSSKDLTT